uniref:Uncharacterized protein n=1 Tax=Panagrolaimus davidi TaxID=227884 RepID=A0A914R1V6_9BILA
MENRQKENADTILNLQNEEKTLKAKVEDATQKLRLMEFEKDENVILRDALQLNEQKIKELNARILEYEALEKIVAEQKEQINALEKSQKEASELQLAHEKDALQRVEDKLNEYKLLVAEKDEIIEKSKNKVDEMDAKLGKTIAEHKKQEKIQKEAYELQLAQMKKEYDLEIKKLSDDLKEANEKVVVAEAKVQTDQTENGSDDDIVQPLAADNAELLDPIRTCNLFDFFVNGEIAYQRLNGKVLPVKNLDFYEKWSVSKIGISFEHSGFQISPQELFVANHPNLSSELNRIKYNNIAELSLCEITIPFSDYKKLTSANKIYSLRLEDVIVNDENGIKVEIDKLWKEVKNVKELTHNFTDNESMHEIAQKLVELTPFPNLNELYLWNVQEGFDLQAFYQFLIKNTKVDCTLYCSRTSLKQMQDIQKELPTGRHFRIVAY